MRTLLDESHSAANVLINYDTGERLTNTAKTFGNLSIDLRKSAARTCPRCVPAFGRSPASPAWLRSPCSARSPSAALGTILLIGGLID